MSKPQNNISQKKINVSDKGKNELNDEETIIKWINEIKNDNTRENAIENLSKNCENINNLAIYLWYSRGTIAALLQEIISIYPYLSTSKLTLEKTTKICNIISLFHSIASNNETRREFVESKIPIFLYPFLNNSNKSKPYEYLKITSLNVIGALVKYNDPEIYSFLIDTAITPILLKIMEKGSDLSEKTACCIVHQIVQNDIGMNFICQEKERYCAIIQFMKLMLKNKFSPRILNRIFKTFKRLAENKEAKIMIQNELIKELKEDNYTHYLDAYTKNLLNMLLKLLNEQGINENQFKESMKNLNGANNNYIKMNNIMSHNNIINNNNMKNNMNPQMNMNIVDNNLNRNNINNNLILVNQLNQMKMQQSYMIPPNYGDLNFNNYNNYNIYSNNDGYINNLNFLNNQNANAFNNINYYNMYNNN